jgi:hypothetical protein
MKLVSVVAGECVKRADGDELRRIMSSGLAAVVARKHETKPATGGSPRRPVALSADKPHSPQPESPAENEARLQHFADDSLGRQGAAADGVDWIEHHERVRARDDAPTIADLERERILAIPRPSPPEPDPEPQLDVVQQARMLGDTICTVPEYFRTVHRVR